LKLSWKRTLFGCLIVFVLAAIGAGAYGWHLYRQVEEAAEQMYQPLPETLPAFTSSDTEVANLLEQRTNLKQGERAYTVLIIGVDSQSGEKGRADTLVVASIHPKKKDALLLSIPRDTRVEIAGRGTADKINHAYAYGGAEMTLRTVERWLDYPIDYYVSVNMEGFTRIIDLIGGVEVNNPRAFTYKEHRYEQGVIRMDGIEALEYSRMRKDDPRGDLGRNERQRQVLASLADNTLRPSTALQLEKLVKAAAEMAKTNMTFKDMKAFAAQYRERARGFRSMEVAGSGTHIQGIYYYIVREDERERLHDSLKQHGTVT